MIGRQICVVNLKENVKLENTSGNFLYNILWPLNYIYWGVSIDSLCEECEAILW